MTGPKLENALRGLQDAINELDSTILDTAGRFNETKTREISSGMGDVAHPIAPGLSTDMLRAELESLRQMIEKASSLINDEEKDSVMASDEVLH